MARTNPLQFIQQVRAETAKVTWPTRREVGLTTIMVMIMATLFATFFFLVDLLIRFGLETILRIRLLNPPPAGVGGRFSDGLRRAPIRLRARFHCALRRARQEDCGRGAPLRRLGLRTRWRCAGTR